MDLVARYSKLGLQTSVTTRALAVPQRSKPTANTSPEPRVHRLADRLSEEQRTAIVAAYAGGQPLVEIKARFGVTRYVVHTLVGKAGIPLRQSPTTQSDADRAAALYQQGLSLADVGRRLGRDPATIRLILMRRGIQRRDTSGREPQD